MKRKQFLEYIYSCKVSEVEADQETALLFAGEKTQDFVWEMRSTTVGPVCNTRWKVKPS